jgi:two-component system cell cycle sensor histidine kinase/response regulator CckA
MTAPSLPGSNAPEENAGKRFQDLFENAPVGLWEVDATGSVVAMNQRLLQWLGLERIEAVKQQRLEDLVSPESAATVHMIAERSRATEQVAGVTLRWQGPGASQDWYGDVVASAVYGPQGQWVGWRGAVMVVTQPAEAIEHLLQERTLEAVERLASGVAHKFNNLLQVIQGYAELGLITLDASHAVHGNLSRIKEAAQRAATLVQGLVAFSRRQVIRRRQIDLSRLLNQIGSRLQRIVPPGIDLRLAQPDEQMHVFADAASIEQLLMHLILNACEAMPQGGVVGVEARLTRDAVRGTVPGRSPGVSVRLSVTDSGGGIDQEIIGQIFEPFFTTKDTANGLGLAVVWGIVKQHGGHVEIDSQVGHGTTVRVYLPAEERATS